MPDLFCYIPVSCETVSFCNAAFSEIDSHDVPHHDDGQPNLAWQPYNARLLWRDDLHRLIF